MAAWKGGRPVIRAYSVAPRAYTSAAGPTARPLAPGLLRRHVAGRAHDLTRAGQTAVALELLRQPEVGDPRVAFLVEQDVARLEVAVDHAALVGIVDRVGHRGHQRGRLAGRQRPVGQPLRQALALDEAHREVVLALVLADLVDRHDARVVEVGRRLGLGVEPLDVGLVGKLAGEDHLRARPCRLRLTCRAWNTTPMPPRAISRMIS